MSATPGYHAMRVYFALLATEQMAVRQCKAEQEMLTGISEPAGGGALATAYHRLVRDKTTCIVVERLTHPEIGTRAVLFKLDRETKEVVEVYRSTVGVAGVWDGITKSYIQGAMAARGMTGEIDFYRAAGVQQ